jgi:regulator of RNase E activity RraA
MPPGLAEAAHGDVPDHPISRAVASGLARHLVEHSLGAGFDTAASRTLPAGRYGNHSIPHGYGFIYQRILGEASTVPFVPVFVNTFYEPNPPTAARCVAFGAALAAAIASFPDDLRVGVVASGGLSHFVVDEELDQRFLAALRSGDLDALAAFTPSEMVSGSSELRNWIVVASAMAAAGLEVASITYEPCYRTEAGTGNAMGFATWGPAPGLPPADPAVLARLRGLDACAVSDALDALGLPGAVTGIGPMWTVDGVTAGRVRTVRAAPVTDAGPTTHIASPLVATAHAGDVIVIDNAGRVDVSCWGGLLAEAAVARRIAGVIVDGACRDVQESEALGLPLHARAAVPVSARGRIVQEDMDVPVQIGGVTVRPGDWVVADRNGIAFVPQARLDDVVAAASRIVERERRMGEAVRAGRSVVEVMHDSQFTVVES